MPTLLSLVLNRLKLRFDRLVRAYKALESFLTSSSLNLLYLRFKSRFDSLVSGFKAFDRFSALTTFSLLALLENRFKLRFNRVVNFSIEFKNYGYFFRSITK